MTATEDKLQQERQSQQELNVPRTLELLQNLEEEEEEQDPEKVRRDALLLDWYRYDDLAYSRP